ncbi:MAG: DUF3231 family protein [Desulfitobacteriaceae bacterium]|nr:DUF3231 family protein [Desulfitobacteriaceae bacterium]MDD4753459.1 DUF3231 family protein [Desulfitobacteriaceae bacterium]
MVFSSKTNVKSKKTSIDVREAFNLWDLLESKYRIIDLLNTFKNDASDADLKIILNMVIKQFEKYAKEVENYLKQYSILSPDKNRRAIYFPQNSEAVTDEFIASNLFICIQEELEKLSRGFRTSTTNTDVRNFFIKLIKIKIEHLDKIISYLKLKGWIETPPIFIRTPASVDEKISTMEIADLWDHLTFRYDNMMSTEVMQRFSYDGDFKLLLDVGLRSLRKQVKTLEKELQYFGVPLPNAPGEVTITPDNTEILFDDHIFRTLLEGMQGALVMHIQPLKECTVNDRVRNIFKKLLLEELDFLDDLYKFGKLKGWFHPIPMYGLK